MSKIRTVVTNKGWLPFSSCDLNEPDHKRWQGTPLVRHPSMAPAHVLLEGVQPKPVFIALERIMNRVKADNKSLYPTNVLLVLTVRNISVLSMRLT